MYPIYIKKIYIIYLYKKEKEWTYKRQPNKTVNLSREREKDSFVVVNAIYVL